MPPFRDITGKRFGRLVARTYQKRPGRNTVWFCDCDCGTRAYPVLLGSLTQGKTVSCGCRLQLSAKAWSALTMRRKGDTYANIGQALGVSTERARQLVAKARKQAERRQ